MTESSGSDAGLSGRFLGGSQLISDGVTSSERRSPKVRTSPACIALSSGGEQVFHAADTTRGLTYLLLIF